MRRFPMEAVARRVLELHEELAPALDEATQGLVLEHLAFLLEDEATVDLAVATMELLGKDKANELYRNLAPDHQQKVYTFLKSGSHSRPKGEVMMSVGEALKTKIFGASLAGQARLDQMVRQKDLALERR